MRQARDMLDEDGLAAADHADRPHPQRTTGAGLDSAHRGLECARGDRTVERLADFVDLGAQGVGDQPELSLPFPAMAPGNPIHGSWSRGRPNPSASLMMSGTP